MKTKVKPSDNSGEDKLDLLEKGERLLNSNEIDGRDATKAKTLNYELIWRNITIEALPGKFCLRTVKAQQPKVIF